jgi:hypothetical protein
MKIQVVRILIDRDPMTKIPKDVFPWEVPIFRVQYGDEKVTVIQTKEPIYVDRDDEPDATEEYHRMRQFYGIEPDTKQSIVDIAYGRGIPGIDAIEKAIKASLVKAPAGDKKPTRAATAKTVRNAIEGAQEVADGDSPPSDEALEARAESYVDPLGNPDEVTPGVGADSAKVTE